MTIFDYQQYGPQWWDVRRGVPTASNGRKIITPAKWEYAKAATDYAYELAADSYDPLYGFHEDHATAAMRNGTIMEPEARRWYEFETDCDVKQVGFCLSNCGRFGCSPDGLVGENGGLELKSPSLKVHAQVLVAGEMPAEHAPQVHWSLIVTGRDYWDYMSYSHGLPPFRVRVTPNEQTDKLRLAMEKFWLEYQEISAKLAALIPPPPPPIIADFGTLGTIENPQLVSPF